MNRALSPVLSTALALFVLADVSLAQEVTLVAGGDIEWSRITKAPATATGPREDGWLAVPYLIHPARTVELEERLGRSLGRGGHHTRAYHYGLEFDSLEEMARHPFQKIAGVFRDADIAFANLETPLSDSARYVGAFRTPTAFADGLRWAGFDVVSTANNHALDAEGQGLLDTKEALWRAGIGSVGTGANLEDARRPFIVEREGIKVAFLGYAIAVNVRDSWALPDRAGVVPLDPFLIVEDIQRVRDDVDFVAVSFHWAIENSQDTHPQARAFAHDIIDAGADLILGHHPHVPRGIEVYRGGVIFYSFGNLIFGHNHDYWMNNYVARMTLTPAGIAKVEVLPVAGVEQNLSQPYVLAGDEARELLEDIQTRSAELDTPMEIRGNAGVILPGVRDR
jgi:poly-gamma-glutamate synthesis protein (capsule biosynthesis protein)